MAAPTTNLPRSAGEGIDGRPHPASPACDGEEKFGRYTRCRLCTDAGNRSSGFSLRLATPCSCA